MFIKLKTALYLISLSLTFFTGSVGEAHADTRCSRLVTLAPSLTEIAFELGLGAQLVGISRYSTYPAETRTVPVVGGLLDPHIEQIVSIKPTMLLALTESKDRLDQLQLFSVPVSFYEHRSLEGIISSIEEIGRLCNREEQAHNLTNRLRAVISRAKSVTADRKKPRVMVVVGGESSQGDLKNVFLSGSDGFYAELVESAGGKNVMQGVTTRAGGISLEGIIGLAPDIIIEVQPPAAHREATQQALARAWSQLATLPAVKNRRIALLDADYATIPGPRFDRVLRDLLLELHGIDLDKITK